MSTLRADNISNRQGGGAPTFPNGAVVSGVLTATTFDGNLNGTVSLANNAEGLTGTPNINVNYVDAHDVRVGGALTITGDLTVNGVQTILETQTLSVQDKNIGIGSVTSPTNVTANGGGLTLFAGTDGDKTFNWSDGTHFKYWELSGGLFKSTSGAHLSGLMKEGVNIISGKLSDNNNINLANGSVYYFSSTETTTSTPNIRYNASKTLNNVLAEGESVTITLITTAAAAGYSAQLTIDGAAVTEKWLGGSAPSSGGSGGNDIYTYTIIKTSGGYQVFANVNNFA